MNSTKEKRFNSMMDVHSFSQTPLLFLTFLQQRPLNNGHSVQRLVLHDVPQVELVFPVFDEAHAVQEVAAELVRMADELNHILVSQAADHLTKELRNSSQMNWWSCLSQGVDSLLKDVPGVHSERMVMALTFSLARAVCERAPRLLRDLCNTMMQHTVTNTSC
ncbi:hypothetical protein AMELA_G00038310 [Ameiurus melas]|uniref:BH3-interacting domain death agonist n=1 Tax=Ameiurus melas TaxID=219545 RepID=A0A7J6BBW5_AMEME|nr:hypothetical protein AMELA_G00038310 [Ameiurus melas]